MPIIGEVMHGRTGDSLYILLEAGQDHREAILSALLSMKSEAPRRIVHGWIDHSKAGKGDPDISATVAWDRYDPFVPYSFRNGERIPVRGGTVYIRSKP